MASANTWYVSRGGQRVGPMDSAQLKHMAQSGQLSPNDHIWREGMPDWVKATMIKGLFAGPAPVTGGHAEGHAGHAHASPAELARAATVAARPARSAGDSAAVPIIAGVLLLATFAIPWFVGVIGFKKETQWIWSWSVIDNPGTTVISAKTSFSVLLIASWVIGLAALIVSPILKGLPRALTIAGLGLAALIFLLAAVGNGAMPGLFSSFWVYSKAVAILLLIFGGLMAAMCHVRLQGRVNPAIRAVQTLSGAGVLIAGLIAFIMIFTAHPDGGATPWDSHRNLKTPFHIMGRVFTMVSYLGIFAAGIMALVHGAVPAIRERTLSAAAVWTLYLTLLATHFLRVTCFLAGMERPGDVGAPWGLMLVALNVAIVAAGVLMIFVSGWTATVEALSRVAAQASARREAQQPLAGAAQPAPTHAAAAPVAAYAGQAHPAPAQQPAVPATASPAAETIEQKFARLEQLRKANILTEEEYQDKRKKLIGEI